MKTLQHQLSNGNWVDINKFSDEDRTTYFLDRCVENNPEINNHDDAIAAMERGQVLRNAREDWYSSCRIFDQAAHDAKLRAFRKAGHKKQSKLRCKSCGQTGTSGAYPFSTLAGSSTCDDCL